MINIVISVLDENISNLKRTLNSIGDTESVIVVVVAVVGLAYQTTTQHLVFVVVALVVAVVVVDILP